jgi:hypothetical protein
MPPARFDPALPLEIEVTFDSPQVASCVLWHRPPGGDWTVFAKCTDEDAVVVTAHSYALGPVPDGTEVRYRFVFIGNPNTALQAAVHIRQGGFELRHVELSGSTDAEGVAVRRGDVAFHA